MKIDKHTVESFKNYLLSLGRSGSTIESYVRDVSQFVEFINNSSTNTHVLDPLTLVSFQDYLREEREASVNTLRRLTISVRQFCRFLSQEHKLTHSPYDYVVIPEREEDIPADEELESLSQLIARATTPNDPGIIACRNAAILCLLGYEGLKTTELIELLWNQVHLQDQNRSTIRITGPRQRVIELDTRSAQALKIYFNRLIEYLDETLSLGRQNVFRAFKGRDASVILPNMTRHGLKFALYEIGTKYNFDHLNADLLRHHSIRYQLLELGKAPNDIMQHLGLKRMGLIAKYARHLHLAHEPKPKSVKPHEQNL